MARHSRGRDFADLSERERRYSGQLVVDIEDEEDGYRATVSRNGQRIWEGWFRQRLVRGVTPETDAWYDEVAQTALERADDDPEIDVDVTDFGEFATANRRGPFVIRRERPAARDSSRRSGRDEARHEEIGPYSEYSPAHERALKEQQRGLRNIRIDKRRGQWWITGTRSAAAQRDPRTRNADLVAWYRKNGDLNMPRGFREEKVEWLRRTNRENAIAALKKQGYRS